MTDQATELRQRMQAERDALAARLMLPSIVTVIGAGPGVGATTISHRLAAALGKRVATTQRRLRDGSLPSYVRQQRATSWIVVDGGCEANETLQEIWELSALVLAVLPADGSRLLEAYRLIKLMHDQRFDTELGTIVNMSRLAHLAYTPLVDAVQERLRNSVERFLIARLTPFGHIPHLIELEHGYQSHGSEDRAACCFEPVAQQIAGRLHQRKQTPYLAAEETGVNSQPRDAMQEAFVAYS